MMYGSGAYRDGCRSLTVRGCGSPAARPAPALVWATDGWDGWHALTRPRPQVATPGAPPRSSIIYNAKARSSALIASSPPRTACV